MSELERYIFEGLDTRVHVVTVWEGYDAPQTDEERVKLYDEYVAELFGVNVSQMLEQLRSDLSDGQSRLKDSVSALETIQAELEKEAVLLARVAKDRVSKPSQLHPYVLDQLAVKFVKKHKKSLVITVPHPWIFVP